MTPFNRSGSKRAEHPKFTISTTKVKLKTPHEVIFYVNSLYAITKLPKKLKTTPNQDRRHDVAAEGAKNQKEGPKPEGGPPF